MTIIKTKHFKKELKNKNDVDKLEKEIKEIHRKKREFLSELEQSKKIEFAEKHDEEFKQWVQGEKTKTNLLDSKPLLFEEELSFSSEPKIPKTDQEFGQFYMDYISLPIEEVAIKYNMNRAQVVGYHGTCVKKFLIPKYGKDWRDFVPTKEDFYD